MDLRFINGALSAISEGVLVADKDQRVFYINSAFTSITGYAAEDMIGESCGKLQGPATDPAQVAEIDLALNAGSVFSGEILNYKKSGEEFWNDLRITAVCEADGEVDYYIGIMRDVTERRRAQSRLESLEAQYRLMFDHMEAGVVLHAPGTEILYANVMAAALLGVDKDTMMGANNSDPRWAFIHEDGSPMRLEEFPVNRAIAEQGLVKGLMLGHRRPSDGRLVWLMCNAHPVWGEHGEPARIVVSFTDVTRLKQTEIELDRAKLSAEAASVAKSEFLANMSHEIRTPLTAVIGFSSLIKRDPTLSDKTRLYVQRIIDGGETLLARVNDILDFTKLEANQIDLELHPFSPAAAIDTAVQLVAMQAAQKGLTLEVTHAGSLPALVSADSARLQQILLNLLSNAIKFTAHGGVSVRADYQSDQGALSIAVADTGVGVPADKRETIFHRFSQVDAAVNRKYGGTGLGLAICKELAGLMGGALTVDSALGSGSTFTLVIPAPPACEEPQQPLALPPGAHRQTFAAHILLVDDAAPNRLLARTMLEAAGYQVDEAQDGLEAVKAALAKPYHLILMDMQMPGLDGLAAIRAIRAADGANRRIPILALSANVLADQVAQCLNAGMDDHIPKPFNAQSLIGAVVRWTEGVETAAAVGR